ncbi:MAG: THUMP domain-containing protein [Candidatus Hadarchaeota archaeon]|nr:THUMP domain-containing protein [Candidatus Hadarchaeota archaeon]
MVDMGKLVVTSRGLEARRQTIGVLRAAFPDADTHKTGFKAVFTLETEGDAVKLAEQVYMKCSFDIGRAVAVLAETPSTLEETKKAAVEISKDEVGISEKFCFRLHKRGSHLLEQETPKLEHEIGEVIWLALKEKYGEEPKVDLEHPDITVVAEVLGPNTAVGIMRKSWQAEES